MNKRKNSKVDKKTNDNSHPWANLYKEAGKGSKPRKINWKNYHKELDRIQKASKDTQEYGEVVRQKTGKTTYKYS